MGQGLKIPADMNDAEAARKLGAAAVVSIRDFALLTLSPEQFKDWEERREILEREPWRRQPMTLEETGETLRNGEPIYRPVFRTDWTGTRFEGT